MILHTPLAALTQNNATSTDEKPLLLQWLTVALKILIGNKFLSRTQLLLMMSLMQDVSIQGSAQVNCIQDHILCAVNKDLQVKMSCI